MLPASPAPARKPMPAERRFLVINPFGIGDVLFSTALLRCLKRSFPGSKLFYLCNKKTSPVLANHPLIDVYLLLKIRSFRRQMADNTER